MSHGIVIVGAGHGGAQAAIALRQRGYTAPITMIGKDPELPYERPPLSKDYLLGERTFEQILIRPAGFWEQRGVKMCIGRSVIRVDPLAHLAIDNRGETIAYEQLIWATGGKVRRLTCDGHKLSGIHYLRDRSDADRLKLEMVNARRAVVIGGGYIGLEAAAALRKNGIEVVLLEALDRVLARVAGEALSRFFEAEHLAKGVDVRCASSVVCIEGDGTRVTAVRCADGSTFAADIVLVGIGIVPEVEPLSVGGAEVGNGVLVDARCRTTLADVFAIGDCALHENQFAVGLGPIRIESVQNANDMATTAASEIVGEGEDYAAVPWFWSSQYDLKLQTVGLATGHDQYVIRGDPARRSFSVIYLREGAVLALDCVNAVRDYAQGKALVAARRVIEPCRLQDCDVALKDMPT